MSSSKLTREEAEEWALALESGKYAQGTGLLQRRSADGGFSGFCCLGVLGKIRGSKTLGRQYLDEWSSSGTWIVPGIDQDAFGGMNDVERLTFPEIAQKIRAAYETAVPVDTGSEA